MIMRNFVHAATLFACGVLQIVLVAGIMLG